MFLGGKMIIYINCSDEQFSTMKKKKFSKNVPVWKRRFHSKNCSKSPLKRNRKTNRRRCLFRSSFEFKIRVTWMLLCRSSCSLRRQVRRYNGSTYCFGEALDIWKTNCRKKGQHCYLLKRAWKSKNAQLSCFLVCE